MFLFDHIFSGHMRRGCIIGILILCCLGICLSPAFAQAITEYLHLQSQVQGGIQQGIAKKDPSDAGVQPERSSGLTDAWEALKDSFSNMGAKASPWHFGIILVLLVCFWFLMRG